MTENSLVSGTRLVLLMTLVIALSGCAWPFQSTRDEELLEQIRETTALQENEEAHDDEPAPDYLAVSRELIAKGYYDVALGQLNELLTQRDADAETYHLMATCHYKKQQYTSALEYYHRAIALDGNYAPSYNGIGLTLDQMQVGQREGRDAFARAIALNPARVDFLNNLGFSRMLAGEYQEAAQHFEQCLKLDPKYRIAANNYAVCSSLLGEFDRAMSILKKSMPLAQAYNNMGVIYEMSGDNENALKMYQSAMKLNPAMPLAQKNNIQLRAKCKRERELEQGQESSMTWSTDEEEENQ